MNVIDKINQKGATLIDVRESMELWINKIDQAINIPLRMIPGKLEELRKMKKPLIVFCRSGNRSGQAVQYLKDQGLKEVYNGGAISTVKFSLKQESSKI